MAQTSASSSASVLADIDLKQLVLQDGTFGPQDVARIRATISRDFAKFDQFRDAVGELQSRADSLSPAARVRLGVCLLLIGRFAEANEILAKSDGGAMSLYFLARSQMALGQFEDAIKSYDKAQKAGYVGDDCVLGRAEAHRYQRRADVSLKELDHLSGAVEQTSEYLYQRGATVAALGEYPMEAIALYERAVSIDPHHPGALFGLAMENERRGNDADALNIYKQAVALYPTNVGTLINLGLLYEDMGLYEQAIICFQRVVDAQPMDTRAAMFLKDARASNDMLIDEAMLRERERGNQVLNIPVSDFELSVRSRNCLKNMGVMTLGDLCRRTEQELLSSKNFGETSLIEIRNMLSLKGLELGQFASGKRADAAVSLETLSADEQATLLRPVTDMNLSVRARKCLNRLGIQTIGELIQQSADELLECKNFGVTSLKEIRERLVPFNVRLRGE
ncbi:MAG: DNA-directed RNA polymerase subunit alpha C-terminal domain-containing protein [Thermoguttaceae bacterium]